jgi:hypothetical protein
LPTLYVGGINISSRADGINYVSLTTNIPDYVIEQVRLMIADEHLRIMIDGICQILDYFPEEPIKKRRGPLK